MIKNIFLLLFSVHILGDFYFQTSTVSNKKETDPYWILIHSIIYAAVCIPVKLILPGAPWGYISLIVLSHGIIDLGKYFVSREFVNRKNGISKQNEMFSFLIRHCTFPFCFCILWAIPNHLEPAI